MFPEIKAEVHEQKDCCKSCGWYERVYSGGLLTCTSCGVQDPSTREFVHPDSWESGAEPKPASTYNFKNHVQKYLKPIRSRVPPVFIANIEAIFPDILNAFFSIAPHRKNFISYAYIIGQILREYGFDTEDLPIPTLKTPSKIREAAEFWYEIKKKIGFNSCKGGVPSKANKRGGRGIRKS
jgi:hypothetical protein